MPQFAFFFFLCSRSDGALLAPAGALTCLLDAPHTCDRGSCLRVPGPLIQGLDFVSSVLHTLDPSLTRGAPKCEAERRSITFSALCKKLGSAGFEAPPSTIQVWREAAAWVWRGEK
ncbi:hypothetical protein GGI35DRAFT_459637 [Trichoderma velutinum]